MSLATDILKHKVDLSPPAPFRTVSYRGVPKPKPKPVPAKKAKSEYKHIPGVVIVEEAGKIKFRAYYYDGDRTLSLGKFLSQPRAFAALRLYKLWKRRGMDDIPHKPTFRLYGNR